MFCRLFINVGFMVMPVKIGIDMPVQRNKQSKGLVFEKDLDGTFLLGVYQQRDCPANKVHRRFIEFAGKTYTAIIIDLPDELDSEEVAQIRGGLTHEFNLLNKSLHRTLARRVVDP